MGGMFGGGGGYQSPQYGGQQGYGGGGYPPMQGGASMKGGGSVGAPNYAQMASFAGGSQGGGMFGGGGGGQPTGMQQQQQDATQAGMQAGLQMPQNPWWQPQAQQGMQQQQGPLQMPQGMSEWRQDPQGQWQQQMPPQQGPWQPPQQAPQAPQQAPPTPQAPAPWAGGLPGQPQAAPSNMSGADLYSKMNTLGNDAQKYAFFSAMKGAGGNDFEGQMLQQSFGGDQNKMNQWINNAAYGGGLASKFDPTTGQMIDRSGTTPQSSSVAGIGSGQMQKLRRPYRASADAIEGQSSPAAVPNDFQKQFAQAVALRNAPPAATPAVTGGAGQAVPEYSGPGIGAAAAGAATPMSLSTPATPAKPPKKSTK